MSYHSAVIDFDNNLWTCGNNNFGQLGLGIEKNTHTFQIVENLKITKVCCGETSTVAIDVYGNIWACGGDMNDNSGKLNSTFSLIEIPKNIDLVDVSIYKNSLIAKDINNNLWSYKNGVFDKLSSDINFIYFVCGDQFMMAIDEHNNLWGEGKHIGNFKQIKINFIPHKIFCGTIVFIIDIDGGLWGWGDNSNKNIGIQDNNNINNFYEYFVKIEVPFIPNRIVVGPNHTLLIDIDGNLWGCGNNSNNQLGKKNPNEVILYGGRSSGGRIIFTFVPINEIPAKIISCYAGTQSSLVLDENNNLWASGDNRFGQLGINKPRILRGFKIILESVKQLAGAEPIVSKRIKASIF